MPRSPLPQRFMSATAHDILTHLRAVEGERSLRLATPGLAARVDALKRYQQRRFELSYDDLLHSPRYGAAAQFFLDELYGPSDFRERDAQFARVVPALVRLFPSDIVDTVATLGELHSLSEQLDTHTARRFSGGDLSADTYLAAWHACAQPAARELQVSLTLKVGLALDGITRKPLLRRSLTLMRGPARAAGLGQLQTFLESGFDAFRTMRGAQDFLALIALRERAFAARMFATPTAGPTPSEV